MKRRTRDYQRQVFINCPYDDQYLPLMKAAIFTVYACGFRPLFASSVVGADNTRIDKILAMVDDCRLSIHDISRITTGSQELPRFNMPFEFGIVVGAHKLGGRRQATKRYHLLDSQPNRYQRSLSDSAGIDPDFHHDDTGRMIQCVRRFLAGCITKQQDLAGAAAIEKRYNDFRRILPSIAKAAELSEREIESAEYLDDWARIAAAWLEKAA